MHRPGRGERERHDDRAERRVIGVHPDALAGGILVDDALFGPDSAEERREAIGNEGSPPREGGRGGMAAGRVTTVVVAIPVVLHAAAEIAEPGRVADAHEDASLLRLGDDIGDDRGALVENAHACPP